MRNIFESIMDSLNVLCILVVLVSAATAYGGYTTYQGPVYVRAGEDFSITCTTDAFRFPKWTLNGHSMEGNFALQVIRPKERGRQEAKLHVLSAGPQHSGAYSCDPFDVDKHYIYVVDTERLNDTQKCFLIQPGRSLALSCEPESRAPFFWFYGKENTRYLPKGHVEMRNAQLLFHGVQLSDAGRYTCRSVRDPSIETVFHLVTPITSKQSSHWNTVGRIGASVALDCDFIADPQPHIEWFIGFDHAELKKRAQHRVHISTNPKTGVANSRLIVQNVDPTDTNEYTCRGSHLMCGIHTEQIISMRAQRLAVGISGEHLQRLYNGGFLMRHHETKAHKHRVHEQSFSSTNSNSYPIEYTGHGHTLSVNIHHTNAAEKPQHSQFNQKRRAAVAREQDNIFLDHIRPAMAVQPGDSVVIRCVTPWIGLVNAWKKDDVVLPSGQSGVAMTSVRLRQEEVKELIDKMAEMEEKEMGELAAKQNADREEKLKSKASVKISLGENIQFKVGKVVGVEAHPDDYRKSKNEKSKEEKGEDSSEDSAKDASAEVEGDQEELEQDQKAVQKENGLTGPSAMARQHQKGRMQQHDAGNQHNRVKRQQRSQRGPSERLKAVFSQGQKLELWTLLIENVTTSDTGNYTCGGEAITNFQLRVRDQLENKATIELPESEILTNEEQTKFGLAVLVNPKLQKLILKCNYTGTEDHGDATYAWFKDDQPIQEGTKFHIETTGTASVLTVEDCNVDDAGNYKCKLRGEEATLRVLMYPTLEHVERSKNQVQGDPLTLTCKARGSPTPTIKWLKDGEPLIMDERMEKQDIDSVKDAKLIIRNLQYSDKGKYVCQATSLNVTTEVEINVRVKDKYAALWPFLGICAEVAILCTIIFIYEKRRTKPEFEDDDDKKESSSHRK